jgi:hypothetical protein
MSCPETILGSCVIRDCGALTRVASTNHDCLFTDIISCSSELRRMYGGSLEACLCNGAPSQSIKQSNITDTFPRMSGTYGRAFNPVAKMRCFTFRILVSRPSRLTWIVQVFLVSSQNACLIVDAVQTLSSRNFAYPSNQSASCSRYNQ